MNDASPFLCHRCGRILHPGEGDFYVVKIEAVADPSPPSIPEDQPDIEDEMKRLIEQVRDYSERELMDQVHRRLMIYLCASCYQEWIENPAG